MSGDVQREDGRWPWDEQFAHIRAACADDGWDSYGAGAVTAEAIRAAKALVESVRVVPTVNGGIYVEWANEGMSVEVNDEGGVHSFCFDMNDVLSHLGRHIADGVPR